MKLMSLAATTALVLVSGNALSQQPQPHREVRDERTYSPGVPRVYLGNPGTDRDIDFATASGSSTPVNWSPYARNADLYPTSSMPLVLDTEDPLGPMPTVGDTGVAMASDIATEDRLAQLGSVFAVPEPSAWLMMLTGLGAILFVIRRRVSDS